MIKYHWRVAYGPLYHWTNSIKICRYSNIKIQSENKLNQHPLPDEARKWRRLEGFFEGKRLTNNSRPNRTPFADAMAAAAVVECGFSRFRVTVSPWRISFEESRRRSRPRRTRGSDTRFSEFQIYGGWSVCKRFCERKRGSAYEWKIQFNNIVNKCYFIKITFNDT